MRFTGSWIVGWRTRVRRGRVDWRSARSIVVVAGSSGQKTSDRIEDGACGISSIQLLHVYVGLTTFGGQIRPPGFHPGFDRLCRRISTYTGEFPSKVWLRCLQSYSTPVRPSDAKVPTTVLSHVCPSVSSRCQFMSFWPHRYIAHSSFSIIFPMHVAYLSLTTGRPIKYYMNDLSLAIKRHIAGNPTEPEDAKFPWQRFTTMLVLMTVGVTLPALLWFCAVSLAP